MCAQETVTKPELSSDNSLEKSPKKTDHPIKSVSIISTGHAEVHPEHLYGTNKPALWWIFMSKQWVTIPINVFIIEHAQGLLLFDTGMDRAVVTNPDFFPDKVTKFIYSHIFRFEQSAEETLTRQLELAGYRASDVLKAVVSHLHWDHAGGISEIPQAELFVSQEAWDHMMGPHPEREGVLRRDIDIPNAKWNKISFQPNNDPTLSPFTHSFDLMGDGSLILLPTPGHLTGSISMLIKRENEPPLLLVADLTYDVELLMQNKVPGTGDKKELLNSYAKVRALKEKMPDLVILPSHDKTTLDILRRSAG